MFQAWEKEHGILVSPSIHFTGGEAFLYTSLRISDHRDLVKRAVERFSGWIEKIILGLPEAGDVETSQD
jgi:hypothetical protein